MKGSRLVDFLAVGIRDPVRRLRFLRKVAEFGGRRAELGRRLRPAVWIPGLAAIVILIPAISFSRSGAAAPKTSPSTVRQVVFTSVAPAPAPVAKATTVPDVWLVERNGESETWSNGLRMDNRFLTSSRKRSWLAFPADGSAPVQRSEPAGIVFHTTESQQAPFEADENRTIRRIGESLLEYVRREQAYNFVIDRFGRVYRVVAEDETANHAGWSAWADEKWLYVNLNESFLAVAFEANGPEISPGQTRSAAMLIEMLRARFRIPDGNLVTHAQVSVNPANMRVGWHVDWAAGFPFESLGLADNYATPLPALWAFGFDGDAKFRGVADMRMRAGMEEAAAILEKNAREAGLSPADYKARLRRRYRDMIAEIRAFQLRGDGAGLKIPSGQ